VALTPLGDGLVAYAGRGLGVDQREALLSFAKAIGSRDAALRRDECSDWRINGAHGHVFAVPEGFQVFVLDWSAKGWNAAKRALSFAKLCNDGDDEGAFILDRLPTAAEAEVIRHWCRIAKKRAVSEEMLARLRAHGFRAGRQ
jgi:hypothetical protein